MGTRPVTAKIRKPSDSIEIDHDKLASSLRKILKHKPVPMKKRKRKS